jgi:hypothetical protein
VKVNALLIPITVYLHPKIAQKMHNDPHRKYYNHIVSVV